MGLISSLSKGTKRNKSSPWFPAAAVSGVFAGFIAYCFISMIAGQAGLLAYRDLKLRMSEIQLRLDTLQAKNLELRTTVGSLTDNADRIAREARELGYARKGERFVTLSGIASSTSSSDAQVHSISILPVGESSGLPDIVVKELSVVIGIAVLMASFFLNKRPKASAS